MKGDRPSFTASAVAAARAVSGVDPIAPSLIDGPAAWFVRAAKGPVVANVLTLGLVDHLELRTRAIDAVVRDAVANGTRQLVILGAGLDARAWRIRELADTVVFEVHHPSTQRYKKARIRGRTPRARAVRFLGVDFERDSLDAVLESAGHDASAPTMWIWEGVTMYLEPAAMRATLATVAARSAPGSTLAVTYAAPRRSLTSLQARVARSAFVGFRLFGEPIVGLLTRAEMRAELDAAGFALRTDTRSADWAARFDAARPRWRLLFTVPERLAIATR